MYLLPRKSPWRHHDVINRLISISYPKQCPIATKLGWYVVHIFLNLNLKQRHRDVMEYQVMYFQLYHENYDVLCLNFCWVLPSVKIPTWKVKKLHQITMFRPSTVKKGEMTHRFEITVDSKSHLLNWSYGAAKSVTISAGGLVSFQSWDFTQRRWFRPLSIVCRYEVLE